MTTWLFLDLETTGKDPERDDIVEVYVQPVDAGTLRPNGIPFHAILRPSNEAVMGMDPFVVDMHTDTGLMADAAEGEEPEQVFGRLSEYLRQYPRGVLAGRNVGTFDKAFLRAKGVDVSGLHFRCIDVSTLLQFCGFHFPDWSEPGLIGSKHRARDDVLHDIDTLHSLADWIG